MGEGSPSWTARGETGLLIPCKRRMWSRLAALAVALVLASCETVVPPPPEPPGPPDGKVWREQRLTTSTALSAAVLHVSYDSSAVDFRGLDVAHDGAVAVSRELGSGLLEVTWFSPTPREGRLLTLHWELAEAASKPTAEEQEVLRGDGTAAPGSLSLSGLVVDGGATPVERHDRLGALGPDEQAAVACRIADYPASLAGYPLGDLDADGSVDLRDVVHLSTAIRVGDVVGGGAHALFHGDLSGDCSYDEDDVKLAFHKATTPNAVAAPVAKPLYLSYSQLRAGTPVIVGNAGNAPSTGLAFEGRNLSGTTFAGDVDWVIAGQSAVWTLASDPNDAIGTLRMTLGDAQATVDVGNIAILVAGQSNAVGWDPAVPIELTDGSAFPSVRMLGNDYVWKPATEPLDDPTGQLDTVSKDAAPGASAGTALGRLLNAGDEGAGVAGTGRAAYLIPAGLGASRMTPRDTNVGWYLGPEDLTATDRGTLFGSAMYRALVSSGLRANPAGGQPEGGPVSAVFWYQGESDNSTLDLRRDYSPYTVAVFEAMMATLTQATNAVDPVIIYAQLAAYGCCQDGESVFAAYVEHLRSHDIAERQRRLEEGSYLGTPHLRPNTGLESGVPGAHMVVTHDLARFDRIHLSAASQQELARRVALAYQEHVLGWDVDGTGPRLVSLTRSGSTVTLTFDREVTAPQSTGPAAYSGYFTAWSGVPNGGDNYTSSYGTNTVAITKVERHASDHRKVIITLASNPGGDVYVRYMRPHEATETSTYLEDVIRSVESGLPAPVFGPLRAN